MNLSVNSEGMIIFWQFYEAYTWLIVASQKFVKHWECRSRSNDQIPYYLFTGFNIWPNSMILWTCPRGKDH